MAPKPATWSQNRPYRGFQASPSPPKTAFHTPKKGEIGRVIVGQDQLVEQTLMAIVCRGNALLVGVPGLAKTLLVSTLARALHLSFKRIQFTPNLLPAAAWSAPLVAATPRRRFVLSLHQAG